MTPHWSTTARQARSCAGPSICQRRKTEVRLGVAEHLVLRPGDGRRRAKLALDPPDDGSYIIELMARLSG